jgi:hypothetical protein
MKGVPFSRSICDFVSYHPMKVFLTYDREQGIDEDSVLG